MNALKELLEEIDVKLIDEFYVIFFGNESQEKWELFGDSSKVPELVEKLKSTNYDTGYGTQYLDGWITLKERCTWLERAEYDGSEWWELRSRPSLKEIEKD